MSSRSMLQDLRIKYVLRLIFCYLLYSSHLQGQDKTYIQQSIVGLHLFADKFTSSSESYPAKAGIALDYLKGFTPRTDFDITLAGSFLSYPFQKNMDADKHLLLEFDASMREKLFPGRHRFNPFLKAGLGVSQYKIYYGLFIPAGGGLQVSLPGEVFLLLHTQYRIPLTTTQAGHFFGSFGIAGIIGKKKKRSPVALTLPQRSSLSKDTDGDGIADSLDACPLASGLQTFNGCPDTDGDGIPDKDDKCPLVRGLRSLQGCPESDRDKDGVIDAEDKCPDLPGFRETAGCPLVEESIQRKISLAAKNIFFETDKYILLPTSYHALDEVAAILQKNAYLKLIIAGHTDNSGTPEKNQTLSERRANAVLEYLQTKQGISKERLSSAGYGSTRPVADNNAVEGRALNRRVELTLKYY
ncbi:MAG TPA: OmpA family protein [Puia sp.]|nr:OmpA family protein [Puia sp.]